MKRWVTRLVVLLLLGAIVNVAVAWGMRLWSELHRYGSILVTRDEVPGELLPPIVWRFGPELRFARITLVGPGLEENWFFITAGDQEAFSRLGSPYSRADLTSHRFVSVTMIERLRQGLWVQGHLVDVRAGWPARAFSGRYYSNSRSKNSERVIHLPDWIIQTTRGESRFDLPIKPIWTGFAINTLFYAAILWLLTFGPFAVRRFVRNKRGHCIKCGYDLGHADHRACPECGAAA